MRHILFKYNREGNATFSEHPTTHVVFAVGEAMLPLMCAYVCVRRVCVCVRRVCVCVRRVCVCVWCVCVVCVCGGIHCADISNQGHR